MKDAWKKGIGEFCGIAAAIVTLPGSAIVAAAANVMHDEPFWKTLENTMDEIYTPAQEYCEEHAEQIARAAVFVGVAFVKGAVGAPIQDSGHKVMDHLMGKDQLNS